MTTDGKETLALLVAEQAGTGREYTFVELSERCVDPETGYKPSANLLWKIARGESVKVNPALIRSIAAGLKAPFSRVATAATRQFIVGDPFEGLHEGDAEVRVAHAADLEASEMPLARAFVEEVLRSEAGDR